MVIRVQDCNEVERFKLEEELSDILDNEFRLEKQYSISDETGTILGKVMHRDYLGARQELIDVTDLEDRLVSRAEPEYHLVTQPVWRVQLYNRSTFIGRPEIISAAVTIRLMEMITVERCTKFVLIWVPILLGISLCVIIIVVWYLIKFRLDILDSWKERVRALFKRPSFSYSERSTPEFTFQRR